MFLIALIPDTTLNLMGNFMFTKIISLRIETRRNDVLYNNTNGIQNQMKICKQSATNDEVRTSALDIR